VLDITSPWGRAELQAGLSGRFNAYNLLAALAVLCLRGIPFATAIDRLSRVRAVPGRMELFGNRNSPRIFVDYSHTPDALQQALQSAREHCRGSLICVFGCGGDRDRGKRPQMGRIAEQYADRVVLTSDNPRSESPERIIQDIFSGMLGTVPVEIQLDRAQAVRSAIMAAAVDDVVLIAGKGHESYQEIGTQRLPFSDRQLVRNVLGEQG
jgi:UDP-N-acetylmuramoyl-L-alanyl-D-glutamate--2,6-diaminopimelate ligase